MFDAGREVGYGSLTLIFPARPHHPSGRALQYGRDYRYNPSYLHPVTQPFLPAELVGREEARFLQEEESVVGKVYDEAALREWEWKELGGERWEGREGMMRRLREAGVVEGEEQEGLGGKRT